MLLIATVLENAPAVPVPSDTATGEDVPAAMFDTVDDDPPFTRNGEAVLAVEVSASVKPGVLGATLAMVSEPDCAGPPTREAPSVSEAGCDPATAIW